MTISEKNFTSATVSEHKRTIRLGGEWAHFPQMTAGGSKGALPVYVRLPPPGARCPITGLSRTTLNSLILPTEMNQHRPPVESKVLRAKYAQRGIRLIKLQSLLDYLESLPNSVVSS